MVFCDCGGSVCRFVDLHLPVERQQHGDIEMIADSPWV